MSKSRRMIAIAAAALAVGAFIAVQALAKTTTWSGAGTNDPVFKVAFKKVRGHPSKVKDFTSKGLRYTCPNNDTFRTRTTIHRSIPVHRGSFSHHASFTTNSGSRVTYAISGKFASKTKATGTYRGKYKPYRQATCVSAKEPWTAHKH